jgi:UDP-perosamine 4-acetyltransferase
MKPVVLIGGGGHAKVVIEILEAAGDVEIAGCVSGNMQGGFVLETPILGDDSCLPSLYASGIRHAFVAVGANHVRRRLSELAAGIGFKLISAVSPQSSISPRARMKEGCAIMPGAVINSCSTIGAGSIVNTGATVDHDCKIGDWVHLAPGTSLAGNVSICEGAFLGVGVRVIPEITVGAWATVGAGTVVVRNLAANVTAVGVPARIISRKDQP